MKSAAALFMLFPALLFAETLSPQDVHAVKTAGAVALSPDGRWIAYTMSVNREANEPAGAAYSELYVVSTSSGEIRPFSTGKVNVSSICWSPDGSSILFLDRRGEQNTTQVWSLPFSGGEARPVTAASSDVRLFRPHPDGRQIAYVAETPEDAKTKRLREKGYHFVFFEENLRDRNLYISNGYDQPRQLTEGISVWDFEFSPDGRYIAAAASPRNTVDDSYMFKKIYLIDLVDGSSRVLVDPQGKMGNMAFSPDGRRLAYAAALSISDHAVSQAYVVDLAGGEPRNLTPPRFAGHVNNVYWMDERTVVFSADEGVWSTLSAVLATGGERRLLYHARNTGVVFTDAAPSREARLWAMIGSAPDVPADVYLFKLPRDLKRMTVLNPWLAERQLGEQRVIRYPARDGVEIEGILLLPTGYQEGSRYPLIVVVHGGPEAHFLNGWAQLTRYFVAGQVLAGRGYVVFYPNYRASTGYGVEFAAAGYGDAAGVEFDDIADGIDYLVAQGMADGDRVGLGGGSYGGYAAAWFASYYTHKVRAVVMFVGISDLVSKRLTTDIPYEELYVHSGKPLEEMWEFSRLRSPITFAHQSRTAVLIVGGAEDTRVHPSQSLEFYRALKMNNHPAVRWVLYPGEGHGNRRQPGRIDLLHRHLQWFDWYVKEKKPLDGPMPPADISECYGLKE